MKTARFAFCALTIVSLGVIQAQDYTIDTTLAEPTVYLLSEEELDELLGPVALHPDALVALILPAATEAEDVVLAARYLERGEDPDAIDNQSWDESVKALARYPELIKWLNEELEWTIQVGDAFLAQPADVMKSIQRLRSVALEAGTLTNLPQQYVVEEQDVIRIVPANPTVIYVPYYDPAVVYLRRTHYSYVPRSYFSFSVGFRVGPWLTYDCDWVGRRIWRVDSRRYWNMHRDWRNPRFPGYYGYVDHGHRRPWHPRARHHYRRDHDRDFDRRRAHRDINNSPGRRPDHRRNDFDRDRDPRGNRTHVRNNNDSDRRDRRDLRDNRDNRRSFGDNERSRRTTPDVAPEPRNPRRADPPQSPRVVSPRQNIINVLRDRTPQHNTRAPTPAIERRQSQPRRELSTPTPRRSNEQPRKVSPRERVMDVLRAKTQRNRSEASSRRSNQSTPRQVTARSDRSAPVMIHGRTITRKQAQAPSDRGKSSENRNRGNRGQDRGR